MNTPWLHIPNPTEHADLRLYCVPYAGGGSAIYREWPRELPGIEVAVIRLPGRENRFRERPYTDMAAMADDLASAIAEAADRPFALFGHSMGGRAVFEVTRRLRALGARPPRHLFVSACRAPRLTVPEPAYHLPRAEFLDHLRRMGGAPPEFFESEELIELLLPVLRADFSVVDTYRYRHEEPLSVPLTVFCGDADAQVPLADVAGWREQTTVDYRERIVPGDHFFLNTNPGDVLRELRAELAAAPVG